MRWRNCGMRLQRGQIEVVGASYGQPYGLFHGGESNVRQRVYGVRAVHPRAQDAPAHILGRGV